MSNIFESDSDPEVHIKTNNEYAKNYDNWRKKEELNKLKTKYGEKLLEDDSSSSSDDDDEGIELTEQVEKQFFKALSALKNKDPRIYDENVKFFDNTGENTQKNKKKNKKEKPMYINDYERELILAKNGHLSDGEEVEEDPRSKSPTYVEEQRKLKESVKKALNKVADDDDTDEEWGGMLKVRQKTEEEKLQEEANYREWLAGQKEQIEDKEVETELKPLKDYWNNPSLDEGEKFLRDYILQKKFLSKEDDDYIPTYEEIVHDSDKDLSEDEEAINEQEEFEHKYNFRFEEPDQEFIKRYPRTVEQSLRKTDDKRKIKRAETKERKQKEKEQKMQELKKLQELKRKEIEEKIQKLKEITGNTDMEFKDEDLESDFDPEAHDKRMQSLFNEDFYEEPEGEQKPEFPEFDELLEIENWEKWKGDENEEYAPHCEDEDFNMDCDYDPKASVKNELIENTKGKKKRKRKSLFAKALSQPKPVFDPNDKTYEEYLDEYYKLDCEDIIGDIPCKFKYRKVVPNDFGLTVEEILTAKDRELNRWCSLKKALQHRPDNVEKYDQIAYAKKANNLELKRKMLPSLFDTEKTVEDKTEPIGTKKNRKNKKIRCKKGLNIEGEVNDKISENNEEKVMKKERKESKVGEISEESKVTNTIEKITPSNSKTKNKKKKKPINNNTISGNDEGNVVNKERKENTVGEISGHSKVTNTNEKTTPSGSKTKENKKKNPINNTTSANENIKKFKKRKLQLSSNGDSVPKKKARKVPKNKTQDVGISDARLSAYGINPKKFKNKLKYKKT